MQLAIKFIGVAVIVQTCVFLLNIDLLRSLLRFFSRGNRIYLVAFFRIAFAVLLFIGATQCRRQCIIIAVGTLLLLSGIAIFTLKPAAFKKILTWYQQRTDLFLRLMACIGGIIGAIIIYAA